MKKILLSAGAAVTFLSLLTVAQEEKAPPANQVGEKAAAGAIYGAYELTLPDGKIRKRFISNGRWTITQSSPASGEMIFHHGGAYVFDGVNYIETVDYAAASTKNLIGNRHKFVITVKEGSIHMRGVENPWDEEWVRVKDESSQPAVDLSIPTVPPAK